MKNLITSLLFVILLVNIAALNQCTTPKQTPQQTNDCFHAGYVHIDSLNALRALNEAKLDSVIRIIRVTQSDSNILKVTMPFEGEHEYDIHIPDSLKVIMSGPYSPVRNTYRIRLFNKQSPLNWE